MKSKPSKRNLNDLSAAGKTIENGKDCIDTFINGSNIGLIKLSDYTQTKRGSKEVLKIHSVEKIQAFRDPESWEKVQTIILHKDNLVVCDYYLLDVHKGKYNHNSLYMKKGSQKTLQFNCIDTWSVIKNMLEIRKYCDEHRSVSKRGSDLTKKMLLLLEEYSDVLEN